MAEEDPQWTSGELHVSAAEGEGLRQMEGAVAESEKKCFGMFILINRLTWQWFLFLSLATKPTQTRFRQCLRGRGGGERGLMRLCMGLCGVEKVLDGVFLSCVRS